MSGANIGELSGGLERAWYQMGGHGANRAWAAFRSLEMVPTELQPTMLRTLCERSELWDSSGRETPPPGVGFTDQEIEDDLAPKYGRVMDALLEASIAANPTEDDFYRMLWEHLHNPFFSDDRIQGFCLFWALVDLRIPYFRLEQGLRMGEEEYRNRHLRLYTSYAKTRFILRTPFEMATEQAALILDLIQDIEDRSDQVIVLADLIQLSFEMGQLAAEGAVA